MKLGTANSTTENGSANRAIKAIAAKRQANFKRGPAGAQGFYYLKHLNRKNADLNRG